MTGTIQQCRPKWQSEPDTSAIPRSLNDFVRRVLARIDPAGVKALKREAESEEYGAARFEFLGKKCLFRQAKTTPKKVGQFVTIWKRAHPGAAIAPFDVRDAVDLVVVAAHDADQHGYFVFEKRLLVKKRVFCAGDKAGKRAMRVYAPWVKPTSKQAIRTQAWQVERFVALPVQEGAIFQDVAQFFRGVDVHVR